MNHIQCVRCTIRPAENVGMLISDTVWQLCWWFKNILRRWHHLKNGFQASISNETELTFQYIERSKLRSCCLRKIYDLPYIFNMYLLLVAANVLKHILMKFFLMPPNQTSRSCKKICFLDNSVHLISIWKLDGES